MIKVSKFNQKKLIFKNPEDVMSLVKLEVNDIFEVGPNEIYLEIIEKPLIPKTSG